jgi:hypothetical protein
VVTFRKQMIVNAFLKMNETVVLLRHETSYINLIQCSTRIVKQSIQLELIGIHQNTVNISSRQNGHRQHVRNGSKTEIQAIRLPQIEV